MQTLAVFVISAAYGRKLAVATMLLYLAEGAVGFPVFSKGGGLAYLAGPTAGYLIAYPFAAAIVGWAADRGLDRDPFRLFVVMLVAEVVILGLGACPGSAICLERKRRLPAASARSSSWTWSRSRWLRRSCRRFGRCSPSAADVAGKRRRFQDRAAAVTGLTVRSAE